MHEYFPEPQQTRTNDILALDFLNNLKYEATRCFSLNNEKVYKDWKHFLDGLPSSNDEIVPRIEDKYVLYTLKNLFFLHKFNKKL